MPTPEQLQKIYDLSDGVLYPEAVAFIRRLVDEQDRSPLPASQVTGLLNVTRTASYSQLEHFIRHQRERNWTESKQDIKIFYTELEKLFNTMKNKRVKDEFQLLRHGLTNKEISQEIDELMIVLARDFIQHLITENGLLAVKKATERAKRR
ncbi:MAG: hypothetical protein E6J34_16140 [Chloroflexi bacterium]|nr:MAG: hypothetical protein E6J34_16140 [Chloroflexota bacterium]